MFDNLFPVLFDADDGAASGAPPVEDTSTQADSQPPSDTGTTAPTGTETEPDPWDDESVETFSRSYVKKLREEAAKHRTELQQLRERFGVVEPLVTRAHPEDLQHFAAALTDLLTGDEPTRAHAGRWLAQVGAKTAGAKRDIDILFQDVQEDIDELEDDLGRELTPAEVKKLVDEAIAAREKAAQEEAAKRTAAERAAAVEKLLEEKGYGKQDGKPNPEALVILARAAQAGTVNGDHLAAVTQAIEQYEAEKAEREKQIREEAIKAFIEERKQDSAGNPRVPGRTGVAAADPQKRPLDLTREERIALRKARLAQQLQS